MNTELIQTICQYYKLGSALKDPMPVKRGFMHDVWHLITAHGEYAIKRFQDKPLDHNIFVTETISLEFKNNNIPAITALHFPEKPILLIDNNYFVVYPWCSGKILARKECDLLYAKVIGHQLGKIHKINLQVSQTSLVEWPVEEFSDWLSWSQHVEMTNNPAAKIIQYYLPAIKNWLTQANNSRSLLTQNLILSHIDLLPDNVIWKNPETPVIIDWDYAGYINRDIDVLNIALNWCGIYNRSIHKECFNEFILAYKFITHYEVRLTKEIVYASLSSWINWLALNIKRLLGIYESTIKQQQQAAEEIKITCEILEYLTSDFLRLIDEIYPSKSY